MNFIPERKMLFNVDASQLFADDGRKSVKFNGDARSLTNIRILSVYGDC